MFMGHYEHTIDEKGRVTIPSKFREELGDTVVIAQGFEGNLTGYIKEWFYEEVAKDVLATSRFEAEGRKLRRLFFTETEEIEIDKAGRILLPAHLRGTANLTDCAILVGTGDSFELWSPENWRVQKESLNAVDANKQRPDTLDSPTRS